ncbi:TetR/AcrR family transcriptional repressor of nem operon [Actinoplanes tereljensis]|uniref:TetR family transcriptional regulator n=1 Tax=Paractinoplanes tereljensis TaxID=571912 RepID=A0A919TSJ9_9ACTN|nr:TetR family transcriptional regulator [Actinoplanes tereljensis]GIF19147.1 TetR family transcriptional regulator [Actinoplanes tereljensis]
MGRPRAFDEATAVASAAALFASRAYDGISVDDLVNHLGVHRNSLYQTFGSKRGLYLRALRWHLDEQVRPALRRNATFDNGLDFLLLAATERAPADPEVATEITRILAEFDEALTAPATSALLGDHLRARLSR